MKFKSASAPEFHPCVSPSLTKAPENKLPTALVSPPPTYGGGANRRGRVRRPEPGILSPYLWGAGNSPAVLQNEPHLGPQLWRYKGPAVEGSSGGWVSSAVSPTSSSWAGTERRAELRACQGAKTRQGQWLWGFAPQPGHMSEGESPNHMWGKRGRYSDSKRKMQALLWKEKEGLCGRPFDSPTKPHLWLLSYQHPSKWLIH